MKPKVETLGQLLQRYIDEDTYSFSGFSHLDVNTQGAELETPLHMAIRREAIEDVKTLIASGANVNAKTDIGTTPLECAVRRGNLNLVQLLLDAGAKDSAAVFEDTALNVAKEMGRLDIMRALERR